MSSMIPGLTLVEEVKAVLPLLMTMTASIAAVALLASPARDRMCSWVVVEEEEVQAEECR